MKIQKLFGIEGAKQAEGLTVIIDIFRAATVSAYLLDKGVKEIIPVSTKEEAFTFKEKDPAIVLVGEEKGYKIPGFDYGNSPYEVSMANNLQGKVVIHRSTQGTQGLVNAKNATEIIFGSFVTASAIAYYIQCNIPKVVSIIAMDGMDTEDDIYADFLIAKISNKKPRDIGEVVSYLQKHPAAARFLDPGFPEFPKKDFDLCLEVDRFDFVPLVENNRVVKRNKNI